jgi:hypothetical protein
MQSWAVNYRDRWIGATRDAVRGAVNHGDRWIGAARDTVRGAVNHRDTVDG